MIGYTILIIQKEISKLKEIKSTIISFLKEECIEDEKIKEIDDKILELENSIKELTQFQESKNEEASIH